MPNTAETWLQSFLVNSTASGSQNDAVVTQLADGNILVTWTSSATTGVASDAGLDIVGQIFDPLGNKIGGEIQLNNSYFADDESNASITALPGGGFIVVFEDYDFDGNFTRSIRLNEYDASGNFVSSGTSVVNDSSTAFPNYNDAVVAASSDTSVMIVYEKTNGSGDTEVYYKIYNPNTNAYGTETSLMTSGTATYDSIDISVLSNGNHVITAGYNTTDNAIVMSVVTSTGTTIKSATFVDGTNNNGESDYDASVTALTGGGFVVSWTNIDTDTDINYQVYAANGTTFGTQGFISNSSSDDHNESVVVALNDGGFMIVFDDDESGQVGVKAQRFNSSGAKVGSEYTITSLDGTQIEATLLADGRVSVTYTYGNNVYMEIIDVRDSVSTTGVSSSDYVVGTIGDDDLVGVGSGFESVLGWDGNDTLGFSGGGLDGGNTFDGGNGTDTFDFTAFTGSYDVNLNTGVFELVGGGSSSTLANIENISAGAGNDVLTGASGKNVLRGGGGDDTLKGNAGRDKLFGEAGKDTLQGGGSKDVLKGGAGGDVLKGGNGNDKLFGGNGRDKLTGGNGDDLLVGGGGVDKFIFGANDGHDTISDFVDGTDKLDLSAFGFANKAQAKSHFNEVGTGSDDHVQFDFNGTTIEIYGLDLGNIDNSDIII